MTEQVKPDITYDVSLQLTKKTFARHHCMPDWVKVYLPKLKIYSAASASRILKDPTTDKNVDFDKAFFVVFIIEFVYSILLERICLECRLNNRARVERGLGKVLIRGRCKPYEGHSCKLDYIANEMFKDIDFDFDHEEVPVL